MKTNRFSGKYQAYNEAPSNNQDKDPVVNDLKRKAPANKRSYAQEGTDTLDKPSRVKNRFAGAYKKYNSAEPASAVKKNFSSELSNAASEYQKTQNDILKKIQDSGLGPVIFSAELMPKF